MTNKNILTWLNGNILKTPKTKTKYVIRVMEIILEKI